MESFWVVLSVGEICHLGWVQKQKFVSLVIVQMENRKYS